MSTPVTPSKEAKRALPATPWGLLPPRWRVLYVTTPRRTGAWLAEAFASDSACEIKLEEACGASAGLSRLREQVYDAVLAGHEPPQFDALEFANGLRAGGGEEPLIILGQPSEQEMSAVAYEVGADAYVCANTATTRTLLWIVARATERHHLIRENRRLSQAQRHRLQQEHQEAQRLLTEQRGLVGETSPSTVYAAGDDATESGFDAADALTRRAGHSADLPPLAEHLGMHYREMLRAHVIMGSGNLSAEMSALAEMLAAANVSAQQTVHLHLQVLEELVRGLGNRSARHVMTRADLLLVDVLVHLAEQYRLRAFSPLAAALAGGTHG